jgi:hypothetical protein
MHAAISDLGYLLERGYALASALQLVGNRYQLHKRQQIALRRISASQTAVQNRLSKKLSFSEGKPLKIAIDGYNLLIFLEAALSGGFLMKCADGCLRDLSGIHGSYHSVEETPAALQLVAQTLANIEELTNVLWLFDAPVSNSGRLCTKLREMCHSANFPLPFPWEVALVNNPDRELLRLAQEGHCIVTTDAWILDELNGTWCDLHRLCLQGLTTEILDYNTSPND